MPITRDEVVKVLEQRKATKPCHRCGADDFALLEEFSNIILRKDVGGALVLGGPQIPSAIVACNNCGAITFHALGALGLLKEDTNGK